MAERILLVNPSKRPSKRRAIKKKRSPAQIRATKKLIALNKKRRKKNPASRDSSERDYKPSSTRTTQKRGKTMARKKRRTAAQRAATKRLVALNRRRAKSGGAKRRRASYRRTPTASVSRPRRRVARRRNPIVRRRRRNPIKKGVIDKTIIPALTAASGAVALDIGWAYLPLPAAIKDGPVKNIAKAGGAIALGYLAGMVVSKKRADEMAMGALTVVFHQTAKEMLTRFAPTVRMDGVGYYNAGLPVGGPDMGLYVADKPQPMNTGLYVGGYENEANYYS